MELLVFVTPPSIYQFQGISSASLVGIYPFFLLTVFVRWYMSHSVTSLWIAPLMYGQYKCWGFIASVLSSTG